MILLCSLENKNVYNFVLEIRRMIHASRDNPCGMVDLDTIFLKEYMGSTVKLPLNYCHISKKVHTSSWIHLKREIQDCYRPGIGLSIRDPNRVSVLFNRVLVFQVYKNQLYSGYMKVRFGTGLGSAGFESGLVNLQRTGTTRCTFGFGSQSVFLV